MSRGGAGDPAGEKDGLAERVTSARDRRRGFGRSESSGSANGGRLRRRKYSVVTLSIVLALSGLLASVVETVTPTVAGAASPGLGTDFVCTADTIYGVTQTGTIYSMPTAQIGVNATITATTASATLAGSTGLNALGIVPGGAYAYAVNTANGAIEQYNAVTQTWTMVGTAPVTASIKGAVDPVNGYYYFADDNNNTYYYNPVANTVSTTAIAITAGGTGGTVTSPSTPTAISTSPPPRPSRR